MQIEKRRHQYPSEAVSGRNRVSCRRCTSVSRTPFARSSSVRQPGAIVSSVKFAQCGLNCTQVDGDASRRRPFQSRSSSGEYVRITDILHAGNSPARYPAHRHYASCADQPTAPCRQRMVVQKEQCLSLWRIGELTLKPFQLELAQFAMRDAKHWLSSNKICHCSPINTRLAGEIPASCSALYIAG